MKNLTKPFKICFISLIFCCFNTAQAQNEGNNSLKNSNRVVITKNDLSEYIGIILSDDGHKVLLAKENKVFQVYLAGVSFSQKRANDPNGYFNNSSSFPVLMCPLFWKF